MPELPEVEHIVRYLSARVLGAKIRGVALHDPSARRRAATRPLVGSLRAIRRRGKLILIDLGGGSTLAFHLKLTGKLWVEPAGEAPAVAAPKWTRLTLHLGENDLHFEDPRRLGWFDVVDDAMRESFEAAIGPEPLEPGYTLDVFEQQAARRRGPVKPVLLDPAFVAGVGNIYADEILHRAKIHPLEPIETLDRPRRKRLHAAIISVLAAAVKEREKLATPRQSRVGGGDRTASRTLALQVFQRTGEPCPRCRAPIERLVVRGRGTHVCPRCQPLDLAPSRRGGSAWAKPAQRPRGSGPSSSGRTRKRSSSTRRS